MSQEFRGLVRDSNVVPIRHPFGMTRSCGGDMGPMRYRASEVDMNFACIKITSKLAQE